MRRSGLCRLVILCIPLLMVLAPAAHRLTMALSGSTSGHALGAGDDSWAVLSDAPILVKVPALPDSSTAVPLAAHHHASMCCGADDSSESGESPHEACMAACCPAALTADRHHPGGAIAAGTELALAIPPSASREDIPPPPRRERMS